MLLNEHANGLLLDSPSVHLVKKYAFMLTTYTPQAMKHGNPQRLLAQTDMHISCCSPSMSSLKLLEINDTKEQDSNNPYNALRII